MSDLVYLQADVKLEPLVCNWYAWTHLVSPATHALNVVHRHLPLLKSFIKNPSIHIAATNDPSLFGGPFVQLQEEDIPSITKLVSDTEIRCARLIQLGTSLRETDRGLLESSNGYSLSASYSKLPECLSGLVEFVYDLNDHPKLRVYEELLYDEKLSNDSQEISLSRSTDKERAFFMSTPRLENADRMIFPMRFSDNRLDMLSSMRTRASSLTGIASALGVRKDDLPQFSSFFTSNAPDRGDCLYSGEGVRIRYFGHACVLIQTYNTTILIDPMMACASTNEDGRFTISNLPDHIDYVVLSHNHQDHCSPEILLQIRHKVGRVVVPESNRGDLADPSMELMLNELGFSEIDVLRSFGEIKFNDGRIVSVPFPGEHVDLDIHSRHGIVVEVKGRRLAFLVDSDGCDAVLFKRIAKRIGKKLDALFLGMECFGAPMTWLYGPLRTKPITRRNDESRRLSGLNCARALGAINEFESQKVFVYAMGQEPWLRYIMGLEYTSESIQLKEVAAFLAECKERGIDGEQLYISKELLL